WNRALPVDGGDYVMTGRAPGYEMWQKTVHVPLEGTKLSFTVPALTKPRRATVPGAAPPATPSKQDTTSPGAAPPATPSRQDPTSPELATTTTPVSPTTDQTVNATVPPPPSAVMIPAIDHSPESPQRSSKAVPLVVGAGALALLGGGLGF